MTDRGAANAGANIRARAPNHAVRVGDCVTVGPKHRVGAQNSEGGVGFVVARHDNTKFDLKYSISNRLEKFVSPQRVRCLNPLAVTARHTDASVAERPSIISSSHRPVPRFAPAPAAAVARSASAGSTGVSAITLRSKRMDSLWRRAKSADGTSPRWEKEAERLARAVRSTISWHCVG